MNPIKAFLSPYIVWVRLALGVVLIVACVALWHAVDTRLREYYQKPLKDELEAVRAQGEQAKRDKDTAEAKAKQSQQESIHAYTDQISQLGNRISVLSRSLQDRPRRSDVSQVRADCPSASAKGSELYREDAEFLAREAARADEVTLQLQAAQRELLACQALTEGRPK